MNDKKPTPFLALHAFEGSLANCSIYSYTPNKRRPQQYFERTVVRFLWSHFNLEKNVLSGPQI